MYASHSRKMLVILMPHYQTASEIFSSKPHIEVFFPLHHHTKFPHLTDCRRAIVTAKSRKMRSISEQLNAPTQKIPQPKKQKKKEYEC